MNYELLKIGTLITQIIKMNADIFRDKTKKSSV